MNRAIAKGDHFAMKLLYSLMTTLVASMATLGQAQAQWEEFSMTDRLTDTVTRGVHIFSDVVDGSQIRLAFVCSPAPWVIVQLDGLPMTIPAVRPRPDWDGMEWRYRVNNNPPANHRAAFDAEQNAIRFTGPSINEVVTRLSRGNDLYLEVDTIRGPLGFDLDITGTRDLVPPVLDRCSDIRWQGEVPRY